MTGTVDTHWTRILFYDLFCSAPRGDRKPGVAPHRVEVPHQRPARVAAGRALRGVGACTGNDDGADLDR